MVASASFSASQMMLGHSSTHLLMSTGSSRSETQDSSQGCTTTHYLHKVEVNGRQLSHSQKLNVPAISHHILAMPSIPPGNLILFSTLRLRSISTHISNITIFSCSVTRLHYLILRGKNIRTTWCEKDNVELIDIPFKNTTTGSRMIKSRESMSEGEIIRFNKITLEWPSWNA